MVSAPLVSGRVVLASKSPRRAEILRDQLGFTNIDIVPSAFPENLSQELYTPFEYVVQTAIRKALDVYRQEAGSETAPDLLIAADTIVELNGTILEKPRGLDHHVAMLEALRDSERPHKVYTGVAAIAPFEIPVSPGYALETYLGISEVTFRKDISDKEIINYAASKEAVDAAGGYKIQGEGKKLIESHTGDLFNIIGLPVEGTRNLIAKVLKLAQDDPSDEEDPEELEEREQQEKEGVYSF